MPPATLKTILEAVRYVVVAVNPYCWVLVRGDETLQIPRLGGTVGTDCLHATLNRAGIPQDEFLTLWKCVLEQPAPKPDEAPRAASASFAHARVSGGAA